MGRLGGAEPSIMLLERQRCFSFNPNKSMKIFSKSLSSL
jgi:hypothetical protein